MRCSRRTSFAALRAKGRTYRTMRPFPAYFGGGLGICAWTWSVSWRFGAACRRFSSLMTREGFGVGHPQVTISAPAAVLAIDHDCEHPRASPAARSGRHSDRARRADDPVVGADDRAERRTLEWGAALAVLRRAFRRRVLDVG